MNTPTTQPLDANKSTMVTKPITATQTGGRVMRMPKSQTKKGTRGRGKYLKGWAREQPGYHERTVMMKNCGTKCFLGPRKTFPICTRNTCKVNRKGIYSAYIRAEEYKTLRKGTNKYYRISSKARKLLAKTRKHY